MTTRAKAAICSATGGGFELREVELDALRDDELLVRVVACGICHTDLAVRDGQLPVPLPAVLGHEGAGVVEAVGSAVTSAAPGDRVIMSFNSCGVCPSCAVDAPTYCYDFFPHNWSGRRADGSATITRGGEALTGNYFGQSSFATYAIAHDRNVVRVPDRAANIPLERLAPLGCGLMTGAGAVLRSMEARSGMPIAVFGTGTVGLAAIMAARLSGCDPIIAVDVVPARLALAKELGATHAFDARGDAMSAIGEACPKGLAYAFDTTGRSDVIEAAFGLLAPKGTLGMVGASDPGATLTFNETAFMGGGRRVMGILGGDSDVGPFLIELIDHHLAGDFPFDRLIEYFDFADIDRAVEASENGSVVKPVLRIGEE